MAEPLGTISVLTLNRRVVLFQVLLALVFAFLPSVLVMLQVLPAWRHGLPLPGGWSLRGLAVLFAVSVLVAGYFVSWLYARTHVAFTPRALIQRGPFRSKVIRWSEIRQIKKHGHAFHVEGEAVRIVFNPRMYRDPLQAIDVLFRTAQSSGAAV